MVILTGTEYGLPAFNGVRSSSGAGSSDVDRASPADRIPRLLPASLLFAASRPAVPEVITPLSVLELRRHRTTPRKARKPIRPAAVTSASL